MNPPPHPGRPDGNGDDSFGRMLLDRILAGTPPGEHPLTFTADLPPRVSSYSEWPEWADPAVVRALRAAGIPQPWSHQAEAASIAAAGEHVVVATGTASGKSLAYQLPVLTALAGESRGTALYLSPTKALGADQLRATAALSESEPDLRSIHPCLFDGDTSIELRQWARANSRWIFTNPDMLHLGILRSHQRWSHLLRNLRYVVVDECHSYRGVFGSNVALVLRRLRRIAARYGAHPTFVLASATTADPGAAASRLIGAPCAQVTEDGSPHGPRTIALWEPPLLASVTGENGAPVRRAAGSEASRIMADLLVEGARTLTFVRSRRGAELTAIGARAGPRRRGPRPRRSCRAYRAGYLAEDRRALESALADGRLLGVATTNALELGVDIAGSTQWWWPGSREPSHRSGSRPGAPDAAVKAPSWCSSRATTHSNLSRASPVRAARPPGRGDRHRPHEPVRARTSVAVRGTGAAAVRRRGGGLRRHRSPDRTRGAGPDPTSCTRMVRHGRIRSAQCARHPGRHRRPDRDRRQRVRPLLGTVDAGGPRPPPTRARCTSIRGVVRRRPPRPRRGSRAGPPGGTGLDHLGREVTDIAIADVAEHKRYGEVGVALVQVEVTHQVVDTCAGCRRAKYSTRWNSTCPRRRCTPRGDVHGHAGTARGTRHRSGPVPGALHAAEHAAIGLLPLVATCDRGDIGGVSTALHPDTGLPTVFVYDGHPGGAGFADRGHDELVRWLGATREAIDACECVAGARRACTPPSAATATIRSTRTRRAGADRDPRRRDPSIPRCDASFEGSAPERRHGRTDRQHTRTRSRHCRRHHDLPAVDRTIREFEPHPIRDRRRGSAG